MVERTTERQTAHQGQSEEYSEVTVIFHARTVVFRIKRGSTKKELWEAIKKKAAEEGVDIHDVKSLTITIDLKLVVIDEIAGTIKEVNEETGEEREVQDETIEEDVTVAITDNVEGGLLS